MPTQLPNGMVRMDITDPADLQVLIDKGLIWRSGPKDMQTVLTAIQNGEVKRRPDKEPPEVRAYLDKVAPVAEVESPAEDAAEPGEEPGEQPEEQPGMPEEVEPVEEPGEQEDQLAPDA